MRIGKTYFFKYVKRVFRKVRYAENFRKTWMSGILIARMDQKRFPLKSAPWFPNGGSKEKRAQAEKNV
jgi:hypothetical protein